MIAIVENDTCAVDVIQMLTGCTLGKGNLHFHDHGKMVFTFATRLNGRSILLCLRPTRPSAVSNLSADQRRRRQIEFMLSHDPSEFFDVRRDVLASLPLETRIRESLSCDICGKMVMSTRLRRRWGRNVCIPCYRDAQEQIRTHE
jgi:formylmethanofuran dehydrogenase subunit E